MNPIGMALAKLKVHLRKAIERTILDLLRRIGRIAKALNARISLRHAASGSQQPAARDLVRAPLHPLLLFFHPLNIDRKQVIKQADVVLAMFLLGNMFSAEDTEM
jgi:hypothetical protein